MKANNHLSLLITLLFFVMVSAAKAQSTAVNITNIRSANGQVILNVFKNSEGFDKEKEYKQFKFDKKGLVNGAMKVTIDLEPGVYGVTLLDDENKSGKLEKTFVGMPKEGFGFSNFYLTKMKKPEFDEFKFDSKTTKSIDIKVKYM